MAFGIKFTPLTPATQLPSRRASLVDLTNASASEEVNKAMWGLLRYRSTLYLTVHYNSQYVDAMMNDFFRTYLQNCSDNDHSSSPAQGSMSQIINDDKMEIDSEIEPPEEYDVFPDLAFLESIDPQHFDTSLSMEDQSSTSEYDVGVARMAELRALLLETFPDGMPKEIDYESILADQHVPSDPLDPSFWNYFEGLGQTEHMPKDQ